MSWLLRILYFIFVAVLLRAVLSLFFPGRSSDRGAAQARRQTRTPAPTNRTVRDPQCGMYLEPSLALVEKGQGEVLYFCSETCRDQYLGRGEETT